MHGEPTSRIKLPPGARPFVRQRDLLVGEPSEQRRHRLARGALHRHLLGKRTVQQIFDNWVKCHGLREPLDEVITRLDTVAAGAGLPARAALFTPESPLDALTQTARHETVEAFWSRVSGRRAVELVLDGYCLGVVLVTALGLSASCVRWLTLELLSWFFDSLTAQIQGRTVTRQYLEVPFPYGVAGRRDPRSSARQRPRASTQVAEPPAAASEPSARSKRRMPTRDGRHIASYVEQLVQHGLHHASVRKLAQAQLRGEADVPRSADYDGRQRVQYGLRQARAWLAGVACAPLPSPAQPTRRPATKRSTPPRPRRSPPA